ncbi:MAG TPA: DUF262 domain-containing protein [Prosthecobacter sp.]
MQQVSDKNPLSLPQIARWQLPHLRFPQPGATEDGAEQQSSEWVAEIPSLQRSAVWKPGQVELLWDSLFRGFPVGALVLSDKLDDQHSRLGKHSEKGAWQDTKVAKRHLLDGQQRGNAIALGFLDPFNHSHPPANILWIDLFPEEGLFRRESTRQFLFRLTSRAHPWGYDTDDAADRLDTTAMQHGRAAIKAATGEKDSQRDVLDPRPHPTELWPFRASVPIPLAWLFQAAAGQEPEPERARAALIKLCETSQMPWAAKAMAALNSPNHLEAWTHIVDGVKRALQVRVPLLFVEQETIGLHTRQESEGTTRQNIANIEHLFQRLNNAGSPISPEDLQYSMIKAYWPGVERTITEVQPVPMRSSRLAILGVRASATPERAGPASFPSELDIGAVRKLAVDKEDEERRHQTRMFFGLEGNPQIPPLVRITRQVDDWLLYDSGKACA